MKKGLVFSFFLLLALPYSSFAQEYSYTHYDISEGLAGSTVYCITQDKDGFIWAGTETGLSRFDGTHFRNFTAVDGLPDVEILNIFSDSRGRLWMAPFHKSICFYYKGKIHNAGNDTLLAKIHLNQNVENFAEDDHGNILIQEKTALHLLWSDNRVRKYDSLDGHPLTMCMGICRSRSGNFLVDLQGKLCELINDSFHIVFPTLLPYPLTTYLAMTPKTIIWRSADWSTNIWSSLADKDKVMSTPFGIGHISFSIIADSLIYTNKVSGSYEYNILTGARRRFLPGIEVTKAFRDDEGNTWFTTAAQGIFRLNSGEFRNILLQEPGFGKCAVHSIKKVGNELFLGSDHFFVFRFGLPGFSNETMKRMGLEDKAAVTVIDRMKDGTMIYGTDYTLSKTFVDNSLKSFVHMPIKCGFRKNEQESLFASALGLFLVNLRTFRVTDTLMSRRVTSIYYRNDTTYAGTLDGLYMITKDRIVSYLGEKSPFLQKRISSIVGSKDGTIWIASYDAGIVGYRNGQLVAAIGSEQGLTSDICRTMTVQNDHLWVGTDKGLNRIDLGKPGYRVTRYTFNEGLGSNMINTLYADSSVIYVGTPAGLTYFDQTKTITNSDCRLLLLSATSSGKELGEAGTDYQLPYTDNNIRFEFVGISYRSAGNIMYRYRLDGLDNNWKNTKETFLEYPSLSSGTYELELMAINKFGVPSKPLFLHFRIAIPFWRTAWFTILAILVILALSWLYFSLRLRKIRRRQEEKEKLAKRMAEMEHMAMQAQMNPHFIFNCLNSIQQMVFSQDVFAANKYITGFARLIRATLHNSTQANISLSDEIKYLSGYLELEKLRFKDKMDYTIEVDPALDLYGIMIPPMLIQPYVENSMRHGLRHKVDGKGLIRITISEVGDRLVFTIEDNGIGREKAAQYKTREHIEYQSKGMSLTADRIRLINSVYDKNIELAVIDLKNEMQLDIGTRVILKFPKFDETL
jgi:ligand-binding sensor domain-containing protein/two-component sensor histidine kinase